MTNDRERQGASDDRELQAWQAEWSASAAPAPDLSAWIRRARRRFFWTNLGAAACTVFVLAFYGWYAWRQPDLDRLILGGAAGVLVLFSAAWTVRNARGTWRPANGSTRAFLDLSERRARAKLRANKVARVLVWIWLLVVVPPALIWKLQHVTISAAFLLGVLCGSLPLVAFGFWRLWRQRVEALRDLEELKKLREAAADEL